MNLVSSIVLNIYFFKDNNMFEKIVVIEKNKFKSLLSHMRLQFKTFFLFWAAIG